MTMKLTPYVIVGSLAAALACTPAVAEINDSPYWNLWQTTETVDGNKGDGTSVELCGTSACDTGPVSDVNYATFSTVDPNAGKGSGKIRSFLRFQHNEDALGSADTEVAFNTNATTKGDIIDPNAGGMGTIENQAKDISAGPGDDFNHAIKYTDMLALDGAFSFFLDINEPGGGPDGVFSLLRMEELALFVSTADDLNEFTRDIENDDTMNPSAATVATGDFTDGAAFKVWDMDFNEYDPGGEELGGGAGGKNNVGGLLLNNINPSAPGRAGSGDYDMEMQIQKALFDQVLSDAGIAADDAYVYLYNFAGEAESPTSGPGSDDGEAAAGFEEWAVLEKSTEPPSGGGVPEPATALLMLAGCLGLRRAQKPRKT